MRKIYTRIVLDIASSRVLEADIFEHKGPVAKAKGSTTSTTDTTLPAWLQPYAQQFISAYQGQVFDESGALKTQPGDLNMEVAGLDPYQTTALANIGNMTGGTQSVANMGLGQSAATLGGAYLNPETNPYLEGTFNKAARSVTDNYSNAIAPGIMASAQKSGNFGGSAMDEAMAYSRYGLGENLGNLATSIYGGNYQQERTNQLQTLSQLPNTLNAGYIPSQQLLGAGSYQQQQSQSELDTDYANRLNASQYPFELLSGFGGALGQAGMGSGTSKVKGNSTGMFGTVYCSWIFSHGLMPKERYEADARFGQSLPQETMAGYHLWAMPTVRLMQHSRALAILFAPLVNFFAKEIALRANGETGSFLPRVSLDCALAWCQWLGKHRLAHGNATLETIADAVSAHASPIAPVSEAQRLAVDSKKSIRSSIKRLFSVCRPSTVTRKISRVIVVALNLHPFRALAHISKKVFKRFFPVFANYNSPTTVVGIVNIFRVATPRFHARPGIVGWRAIIVRRMAMAHVKLYPITLRSTIDPEASATPRVAVTQNFASENDQGSALALTKPKSPTVLIEANQIEDQESPKNLTRNVFEKWTVVSKIVGSHIASFLGFVVRVAGKLQLVSDLFFLAQFSGNGKRK